MTDFTGKIVLVTGASRGIGAAVASAFANHGAIVIGTATSDDGAKRIEQSLEAFGGIGVKLDVTDKESVDALVETLTKQEKMPHILINNAGITADNLLLRMEEDEWYRVVETNLNAVYRVSKAFIKAMFRQRFGRIITIGSVVGLSGNSGQSNYTATKAGIIGFSKSLAQEIASRGITVNVVAPGFITTDMTEALPDAVKDELKKRIPAKRLGSTDDISAAVLFLASDGAGYITGETLNVNGGMYMN